MHQIDNRSWMHGVINESLASNEYDKYLQDWKMTSRYTGLECMSFNNFIRSNLYTVLLPKVRDDICKIISKRMKGESISDCFSTNYFGYGSLNELKKHYKKCK